MDQKIEELEKRVAYLELVVSQVKEYFAKLPRYNGFCDECGILKLQEGVDAWIDGKWLCKECHGRRDARVFSKGREG